MYYTRNSVIVFFVDIDMFDVIIVVKASFVRSARLSPIPGYIRICNGKSFKFFWLFPVRSVCVFRSCQPVIFLFLMQSIFFCLDPTHLWNALSSPLPFVFFLFYFSQCRVSSTLASSSALASVMNFAHVSPIVCVRINSVNALDVMFPLPFLLICV